MSIQRKFYLARRDTRWDVYPQAQPLEAIAYDYEGFYAQMQPGVWYATPTSYVLDREVTEAEAIAFAAR